MLIKQSGMLINMSSKKCIKIKNKIRKLEREREKILEKLLSVNEMARGSFAVVSTKCGNAKCRCNHGELHTHSRVSWGEFGKNYTRKVPKEEIPWIKMMTERYREFKKLRKKISNIEIQYKELLNELENEIVDRTREPKGYMKI